MNRTLLQVRDLRVEDRATGHLLLRGVDLDVRRGEACGLVGESGSGKSLTALALPGLLPPGTRAAGGQVLFDGEDLLSCSVRHLRWVRGGRLGMVFQDPLASLSPFHAVGRQVLEVVRRHHPDTPAQAHRRVRHLLAEVGLDDAEQLAGACPHELSGGQRQRVAIAAALAGDPDMLIADEPTTALDVRVQAHILELLRRLCRRRGMALLLISHDLGVVARVAHRVAVLYAGRVVEDAPAQTLFPRPLHPYTSALLEAVPRLHAPPRAGLHPIPGRPPDPRNVPAGCPFAPRCPQVTRTCRELEPLLRVPRPRRRVACHVEVEGAS